MKVLDSEKMVNALATARNVEKKLRCIDAKAADAVVREINDLEERKLNIAVVGLLKRGKSTFCNAFLGRHDDLIAPTDRLPATGIISEFMYNEQRDYAKVIFENGASQEISFDDIRSFVTEEENPENCKKVQKMEVYGKFDLDRGVKLIDLPGDESIHAYHSEIVYSYLPTADIIIFLSSADDPISRTELNLLRKVQPNDLKKVFFVINKIDRCDERELADAELHNREVIKKAGIAIKNDIYKISAKAAMSEKGCVGFDSLLADVKNFLNEDRMKLLLESFCGRVMALAQPVFNEIQQKVTLCQLDEEELTKRIDEIKQRKVVMEKELNDSLQEFSNSWEDMLKEFENTLPIIQTNVETSVIKEIEASSSLMISKKTIEAMPEKLAVAIEDEFKKQCGALEDRAKAAVEKLEKSCPEVTKFLSDQNYRFDQNPIPGGAGAGTWIYLLTTGSTAWITGSAIEGAFTVGLGIPFLGDVLSTVLGTLVTGILGPLCAISALGAALALGGITFSMFRKKKLQKERLIQDLKSNLKNAMDDIRIQRIPYLRGQKEQLIKEIKEGFNEVITKIDNNLHEALEQKKSGDSARLQIECCQNNIQDFNELKKEMLLGIEK